MLSKIKEQMLARPLLIPSAEGPRIGGPGLGGNTMKLSLTIAAAAVALTAGANASAFTPGTPITTMPTQVSGLGGDVKAVFLYYNAADTDVTELTMPALQSLFTNKTAAAGDTVDLGNLSGALQFELMDLTTGLNYLSDTADSANHFHAAFSANYTDFNVGALSGAALASLAGLPNVTFIGWEDHNSAEKGDWDYNDLILAISVDEPIHNPTIPEPLTLSLMGAGLLGAFGLRRKKRA